MKEVKPRDLASLVIHGFLVGYLTSNYFPQFTTNLAGVLFHDQSLGASELLPALMMAAVIYICTDVWRKYSRIKHILFSRQQT
jgi:hypothetical protein